MLLCNISDQKRAQGRMSKIKIFRIASRFFWSFWLLSVPFEIFELC